MTNPSPKDIQVGRFYFRETNRKVTGTITYQIGNGEEKQTPFSMVDEGDFSRNHTWIVYGYFAGKETLKVSSVDVTDWVIVDDINRPVFNW